MNTTEDGTLIVTEYDPNNRVHVLLRRIYRRTFCLNFYGHIWADVYRSEQALRKATT